MHKVLPKEYIFDYTWLRVSVHETNRRQLWTDGIAGTLNDETNNKNLIKFHFKF